jgi:hypothetical protein
MKQKPLRKNKEIKKESVPDSLKDLQHEELSGKSSKQSTMATSQTDDDEDEGLGDGNIGRRRNDPFSK